MVFLLVFVLEAGGTDEQFPFLGEISRGPVNVRAGANINFESIAKLVTGDEVVILGKNYEWCKVQLPLTVAVFIREDYIQAHEGLRGEIIGDRVNVRAKPNSESSPLGQMSKGDWIRLLEVSGGWWRIEPPASAVGWVHEDFVRVKSLRIAEGVLRKNLTADVLSEAPVPEVPVRPVLTIRGILMGVDSGQEGGGHYQLMVDGDAMIYYLQDVSYLERFRGAIVSVDGTVVQETPTERMLQVSKIALIL